MSALKRLGINRKKALSAEDCSPEQKQTAESFGFKWSKRDTYESESMKNLSKKWMIERYCGGDINKLAEWLEGARKIILDAGCGSGYSAILFFGDHLKNHDYLGVDISSAVNVAQCRFQETGYPGDFMQMNLIDLPVPDRSLDLIFSEGVLHHTDSVEESIRYLAEKLKIGGRFLFYVYARKSVVREFTDDLIRKQLQDLDDEQAWQALMPLTRLGRVLGDMKVEIEIPEDIPLLDIEKGKIDLQRFFYWHICKLFYSPDLTLEEMNHINFDWFRPLNCHRHTPEEIMDFCSGAELTIERMDVQKSGVTVVAVKE
jgi:SAM-dependent methyltransferase